MLRTLMFMCSVLLAGTALASTDCIFVPTGGGNYQLAASCSTDATLNLASLPGITSLDGQNNTITAVNPPSGPFLGAVVLNPAGQNVTIENLTVTAAALNNGCAGGVNRLAGIKYDASSGALQDVNVLGIRRGPLALGCQEGIGVWLQNFVSADTQQVSLNRVTVADYQKGGVVANGNVRLSAVHINVGSANLPLNTAANSVQFGFGASGTLANSAVEGNQWDVNASWFATAILVYQAGNVNLVHNRIFGDGTDVGVYAESSGVVNIMNNDITRTDATGAIDPWGVGVWIWDSNGKSKVIANTFAGWLINIDGADKVHANVIEP